MVRELTYETRSQAETVAQDYRTQGYITRIIRTSEGNYKVQFKSGSLPEYLESEIVKEPQSEREALEEFMTPTQRRIQARQITERKSEAKKEELIRQNKERKLKGQAEGTIITIRDPNTYEIVDYELKVPSTITQVRRKIIKEINTGEKQAKLLASANEAQENIVATMGSHINVKGAMKTSIAGQAQEPKAVIAAIPKRDIGAIGMRTPKIAAIPTGKGKELKAGAGFAEFPKKKKGNEEE